MIYLKKSDSISLSSGVTAVSPGQLGATRIPWKVRWVSDTVR